jgi:hypothetical protein
LDLQLPVQLGPITTNVSLNPTRGKVYSIHHYVIKFVSDFLQVGGFLWVLQLQVGGFLWVLQFPPPI